MSAAEFFARNAVPMPQAGARGEIDAAFRAVLADIENEYPGELKITPVMGVPGKGPAGEDVWVAQIGSLESNLDRAMTFLTGKLLRENRKSDIYEALLIRHDKLSSMRSWLTLPAIAHRGTWQDYYTRTTHLRPIRSVSERAAAGVTGLKRTLGLA